jgi:glycine betaine/proline transport system permease protein
MHSPGAYPVLADFPTDPDIRLTAIKWVEAFFSLRVTNGEALFDFITFGIRRCLMRWR